MEITIVIPTYERPDRIGRAMVYWKDYPVKIIIVDGSPNPFKLERTSIVSENITYLQILSSFEERLLVGASLVKTAYAMFMSDDEFLTYPALIEAAEVLKSEPKVAAVLGGTMQFLLSNGKMIGAPCYASAHHLTIDAETPIKRFEQRLRYPGNIIFYSLTRAPILLLAARFIADRRYSCQYISEYQMETMLCAAGKIVVINRLMWLRSLETAPVSFKGWRRSVLFNEWCQDDKNEADLEYLEKSADKFLSLAGENIQNIKGIDFIRNYAKFDEISNSNDRMMMRRFKKYIQQLIDIVPNNLGKQFLRLKSRLGVRSKSSFMQLDQVMKQLEMMGVRTDNAELLHIKSLVEKIKD